MQKSCRFSSLYLALIILLIPSTVSANTLTGMGAVYLAHLLFGNVLIGLIEGLLIARIFKVSKASAFGIMIAANFTSMYAGMLIFIPLEMGYIGLPSTNIHTALRAIYGLVIIAFIATIAIECPFCLWILRKGHPKGTHLIRNSIIASVIAQTVSYALLVPVYFAVSDGSVYTKLSIEKDLSFSNVRNATIYFISPSDGGVYQIRTDGTGRQKVCEEKITNREANLLLCPSADLKRWDLCYRQYKREKVPEGKGYIVDWVKRITPLAKNLDVTIAQPEIYGEFSAYDSLWADNYVVDFRPSQKRDWEFGVRGDYGLGAKNTVSSEEFDIGFSTPFMDWKVSHAIVFPGNQVIFDLGNQIVLLDMPSRKIGLICVGRSPVVVLDNKVK